MELYSKALDLYETSIYYFNRSLAKLKLGNLRDALNDANRAIELNKDYTKAYSRRAEIYFLLGSYELALKDYTKVENIHSSSTTKKRIEECNSRLQEGNNYSDVYVHTV